MVEPVTPNRRFSIPFPFEKELAEFERSFSAALHDLLRSKNHRFLSVDNVHNYSHGVSWRAHASYQPDEPSKMGVHSSELTIRFEDIIGNDLYSLERGMQSLAEAMHNDFMRTLYQTLSNTVEEIGNVVSVPEAGSPAQAFLDMLKKIEFGVDRNGNVTLPEIHSGAEATKALIESLSAQGPDFEAEVERIKEEKKKNALMKEADRRAKFMRYER